MDNIIESDKRLVIVSNRLPIVVNNTENHLTFSSGSGGLVSALAPVLKNRGGVWIGWPGPLDPDFQAEAKTLIEKEGKKTGFSLFPVFLSEEEVKLYYEGFSNEIIWPLFHDLQSDCVFNPEYWKGAQEVNKKFAKVIFENHKPNDFLWIHDYHLMLVASEFRKLSAKSKMGFFLHIPFPSLDIFLKLPWRFQVLHALLEYDLIGFQTLHDQHNFIQCIKRLIPGISISSKKQINTCKIGEREVRVGTFPISIDYKEFSKNAEGKEVADQAWLDRKNLKGQKIVFSCDRLDISKGILYRLKAIDYLLKTQEEIHRKITFFQVVIPSRIEIPKYKNLKDEIDRLVSEINSQYTQTGWVPIHYLYHSISRKELLSLYQISEIALITPIKDGMNLVAKEYIASNVTKDGSLILSEFAGAAMELQREAFLINPYDIEGVAKIINQALNLPSKERQKRMGKMRRLIQKRDVFWWVQLFLNTAFSKDLHDFPVIEEYTPTSPEI